MISAAGNKEESLRKRTGNDNKNSCALLNQSSRHSGLCFFKIYPIKFNLERALFEYYIETNARCIKQLSRIDYQLFELKMGES